MKFIKNAWYAASLSHMVTTAPIKETIFGTPVVIFRTESGQVAALHDRCPHRFAPFSMGIVVGENIECPYHGLQFGADGGCALNPHGDHKIPRAAKVQSFPVAERDGVIWIWPGDPSKTDETKISDLTEFLGNGAWPVVGDSFVVNANAGLVLDNVMDVSHSPFLHRTTFANVENVKTRKFEMRQEGDRVTAYNTIPNSRVSALFAPFWKSPSTHGDAIAHMSWEPPLTARLEMAVSECGHPPESGVRMNIVHLLRPIDDHTTRYFWLLGRNFAMDVETVSNVIREKINYGFTAEDEPAISACALNMDTTDLMSMKPVLLAGDAAAMRTRRILDQMYQAETLANSAVA